MMDVQDTKLISLSMAYTQVSGQLSLCFVFFTLVLIELEIF